VGEGEKGRYDAFYEFGGAALIRFLQDAKARFSELVRRVRSDGPQRVTVHGRDEVVVISAEEIRRLKGDPTGESLIAAMQASPYRDVDIEPGRAPMRVPEIT
jgi:prevent-host-death family protein